MRDTTANTAPRLTAKVEPSLTDRNLVLVKRIQATLDLARHTIRTDNRNLAALLMIVTELVRLRQALRQAWKDDDPSLRTGKHLIKAWFKPFENRVDRAITYILEMLIHQGVSVAGATNRGADWPWIKS